MTTIIEMTQIDFTEFMAEVEDDGGVRTATPVKGARVHLFAMTSAGRVLIATSSFDERTIYGAAFTLEQFDVWLKQLQQIRAEAAGAPSMPIGNARVQ